MHEEVFGKEERLTYRKCEGLGSCKPNLNCIHDFTICGHERKAWKSVLQINCLNVELVRTYRTLTMKGTSATPKTTVQAHMGTIVLVVFRTQNLCSLRVRLMKP